MTTVVPSPPIGSSRLLELVTLDRRGLVGITEHTQRYGPLPLRGYAGRSGPQLLLDTVARADVRGRGGAGFPLAVKMRTVADRDAGGAVVVVNGAESEPLSEKDAVLLGRVPHLVLDGAVLAADSVGASVVHVVAGGEVQYDACAAALSERRDNVAVRLHRGPGGYVSSQETALVAWLNGRPPLPTFTPPLPAHRGVDGQPTLVSNVETLAQLALVGRFGADWYRGVGQGSVPGTTLLTVCGAVERPGVVEVAFGTAIGDVLRDCGAHPTDAVLLGGWFGGWLPRDSADRLPVDPQALARAGTGLGAGVVFALPRDQCGLSYTSQVAGWLAGASAGQCGPCTNGLPAIASAIGDVAAGRQVDGALGNLHRWCALMPGRGACRHPDGTARFVRTALDTFAADIVSHRAGRCLRTRSGAP